MEGEPELLSPCGIDPRVPLGIIFSYAVMKKEKGAQKIIVDLVASLL